MLAIKTKNIHLQEAALGVSGVVTKYNPGLQGHFQILEAQSRSIHLRPEDGKGFLEVAAAQTDKAEGGEVGGGRGRAGRKEREDATAKERQGANGSPWDRSGVSTTEDMRVVGGG